jgi:uncharacterized membrane protein
LITLLWLVPITFVLGPVGAIAFAFSQGLSTLETAIAVSAIHVALVPVWFGIFGLIKYELCYKNRFVCSVLKKAKASKKLGRAVDNGLRDFEQKVGQRGFFVGVVGFTFLFGITWAALGAYLLNIKKRTIMTAIAVGAIASSLFWTFVFVEFGGFLPSPWMLYAIGTVAVFVILGQSKLHERKLIREMSKSPRKPGAAIK